MDCDCKHSSDGSSGHHDCVHEKEVAGASDTAEAIAALVLLLAEAVNITASGTANVDQATTIQVRRTLVHQ